MTEKVYRRKVLKLGNSLAVTLPRVWARTRGLKEGEEVEISTLPDGTLQVGPPRPPLPEERLEAKITVRPGEEDFLERLLIALYEAGYDTIKIRGAPRLTEAARRKARTALNRLSGTEVVEEASGYMVIQSVVDLEKISVERALDRMEVLVRSMLLDLRNHSETGEEDLLHAIIDRDDDVDKFYFLLSRQIALALKRPDMARSLGPQNPIQVLPIYSYGKTVERLGDVVVSVARYLLRRGARLERGRIELMIRAYRSSIRAFRLNDRQALREVPALYEEYFGTRYAPTSLLDMLLGNFLSLCVDVVEARIELDALASPEARI